ncbi:class I SAM-dependent methyltransferase [Paenibacillus humicola]|uniref:class I SAM-dependent methyltransferase n=1 Tax=Paenibacillus humicola TaxID=3110540 RepID=UPI00237B2C57|nr:class I SAM-dependent methyltransferase [Paenibacillus humicola]
MQQHRFDPKNKEVLESPERKKLLSPEQLLEMLPIQKGDRILDIGAGTGYFSIPAAQMTEGTVYALDLEPEMLAALKSKIEEQSIPNIELVEASMTDMPFKDHSIDIVIASLVLHAVKPISMSLNEIKRVMKPNAHLVICEWEPKESPMGPPMKIRISSKDMEQALHESGFSIKKHVSPTDFLYIFIASIK